MDNIKLNYNISLESVEKYKSSGEFENNIKDGIDNLIYKTTNNSKNIGNLYYTKIPLKIFKYDNSKFEKDEDINFKEFTVKTESVESAEKPEDSVSISTYNEVVNNNSELTEQINSLINKYENDDSESMLLAMKDEIINLRIKLGEGETPNDFSEDFPFLAK